MFPAQANLVHHFAVVGCHSGDAGLGARVVDAEIAFRQDYDLLPGDVILFKGFADYFFGAAVGVDVSLGASEESLAIRSKMQRKEGRKGGCDTVSHVFRPTL